MSKYYDYFMGNKVSDEGLKYGYVDYACLAKCFDAVLNNDIISKTSDIGFWDTVSGSEIYFEDIEGNILTESERNEKLEEIEEILNALYHFENEEEGENEKEIEKYEAEKAALENEYYNEIFQYYIISPNAVDLLKEGGEIVFYNEELDMYVWGVTHYGTSWAYVLTNIKLKEREEA